MTDEQAAEIITRLERIERLLLEQVSDRPLTLQEAATYLHLSASFLYKLTSENRIKHSKPNGKKIFFTRDDLNAYLLRNPIRTVGEIEAQAAEYVVAHKRGQ